MTDLTKLQKGIDICGIAAGSAAELDQEAAGKITGAFIYWLTQKVQKNPVMLNVAVGYDSRLSSVDLAEGILKACNMWGTTGHNAGLATTHAMFMSTVLPYFEIDGAIMVTASDQPGNMNGFKFFTAEGGVSEEDTAEILRLANRYTFIGEVYDENSINIMPVYAAYLRQILSSGLKEVPGGLKNMHIVVDASNGAGGFYATEVLAQLGADISGSLFLEPDGTFPNHQPDIDSAEAMEALCKAVADNKADLGILFDADAGRFAAVGPDGKLIARSESVDLAEIPAVIEVVIDAAKQKA